MARAHAAHQQQAERLAEIMPKIGSGNPQRGHDVFFGNKAACHTCHRANGRGGDVGPELSLIGRIRSDRDLAESIVFPSSTIANGYTQFSVYMDSGRTVQGVISHETASSIYLREADNKQTPVSRENIEEMAALPLSIMPQGLGDKMTVAELNDLIAYLRTLK